MLKRAMGLVAAVILVGACDSGRGGGEHTLVLTDGTVVHGELRGRSEDGFRFAVGDEVREYPEADVFSLTLDDGEAPFFLASAAAARQEEPAAPPASPPPAAKPAPAPPARAAAPAPAPPPVAAAPRTLTVPQGTRLMVKLDEDVSTQSHPRGAPVSGSLDAPLTADGTVVAAKGTKIYGRVIESSGGKRVGNQKLVIEFTDITIGDDLIPIDTDRVGAEGGGGSGVRTVGAGALIGGAVGGKSGAGKGALIGAGLSVLAGGSHIRVPGGTLMELHLRTPLTVRK
jgi:hypothetical protein